MIAQWLHYNKEIVADAYIDWTINDTSMESIPKISNALNNILSPSIWVLKVSPKQIPELDMSTETITACRNLSSIVDISQGKDVTNIAVKESCLNAIRVLREKENEITELKQQINTMQKN